MVLNAVNGVLYAAVYSLSLFVFFASSAYVHHSLTKILNLPEHWTSRVMLIISENLNSRHRTFRFRFCLDVAPNKTKEPWNELYTKAAWSIKRWTNFTSFRKLLHAIHLCRNKVCFRYRNKINLIESIPVWECPEVVGKTGIAAIEVHKRKTHKL